MTEVKWHPIRAVETEDGTIKWEGNTPTPYVNVLVTTADVTSKYAKFINQNSV